MAWYNNQEFHKCGMAQILYNDNNSDCRSTFFGTTEESNKAILDSMYRVQDVIYNLFRNCDRREIEANTIDPMRQNAFLPLKVWNINLNGCFAKVSIRHRFLTGCFAEIEII